MKSEVDDKRSWDPEPDVDLTTRTSALVQRRSPSVWLLERNVKVMKGKFVKGNGDRWFKGFRSVDNEMWSTNGTGNRTKIFPII